MTGNGNDSVLRTLSTCASITSGAAMNISVTMQLNKPKINKLSGTKFRLKYKNKPIDDSPVKYNAVALSSSKLRYAKNTTIIRQTDKN